MTDDELLAVYRDGRFRDLIDALRAVAAAAWAEGHDAGESWNDGLGTYVSKDENPYAVSPEGTA